MRGKTSYLLVCADCSYHHEIVVPFKTSAERLKWADAHMTLGHHDIEVWEEMKTPRRRLRMKS